MGQELGEAATSSKEKGGMLGYGGMGAKSYLERSGRIDNPLTNEQCNGMEGGFCCW